MTLMGIDAQCVEVQNISDSTVELSDYALSDDENDLFRFILPEGTLAPNEVKVFTFGDEKQDAEFGFADDETVILSDLRGIVQCEAPVCTVENTTLVWDEDAFAESTAVSLGFPNDADGAAAYREAYPMDGVIISEILADNRAHVVSGGYYDYIELYNAGDTAVNLQEYSISDDKKEPDLAPLGDITLEAGAYIVLACNGDLALSDYDPATRILPIGISKDGESIGLYRNGHAVDYVTCPALGSNAAYGRTGEARSFAHLSSATPASANASAALQTCAAPVPTLEGGAYNDVDFITVDLQGEGEIHYTLDCTEPTASDPVWDGPMDISETTVIRARS